MNFNFAPRPLLTFGLLSISLLLLVNVYIALQSPSLGVQWSSNKDGELFISEVFKGSPVKSSSLQAGDIVVKIGSNGIEQRLSKISITEEPDNLGKYANVNTFFAQQNQISVILEHDTIWLENKSGQRYLVNPVLRKLNWLPLIYWFQLACGTLSFLAGLMVFAFRTQDTASRIYAINGLSFTLVTFAAAVYSGRELAISGDLFRILSSLNHLGSLWFTATFIALAWHVPKRMHSFPLTRTLLPLFTLFWLADTLRWEAGSPENWVQLPILAGLLASFIIAGIQWRRCKQQPDDKQALRWLLLSLLAPGVLFLSLTILFQWLHIKLIIPQGFAFGILLVMYLGISLGVTRFALFELDKWWARIWIWLITGVTFVILDILFASVLHFTEVISTMIAMLIIAFIYLPIRQWLFSHVFKEKVITLEQLIPDALHLVTFVGHPSNLEKAWKKLLSKTFSPLSIKPLPHSKNHTIQTLNQGIALSIPNVGLGTGWLIEYPNQGSRLFYKDDVVLITSLIQMIQQAIKDAETYQKGVKDERQRMTEDLHDDLGAKLLSLVYKSETNEQKKLAKQAMDGLREIVKQSPVHSHQHTAPLLAWRTECQQRALEHQAQLQWHQAHITDSYKLPEKVNLQLSMVLREALSNALKHGDGNNIRIRIQLRFGYLLMSVYNQGSVFIPNHNSGSGKRNMKQRIQNIGGIIRWKANKHGGCRVIWSVPVQTGESA